jgi:hypothetical protein
MILPEVAQECPPGAQEALGYILTLLGTVKVRVRIGLGLR